MNLSGDGSFCSGASSFADFLKDLFEQEIVDFLTPRLDELIQGFLPDPLGIEGLVDLSPLLAGISPGTKGTLEARIIPGGFVGRSVISSSRGSRRRAASSPRRSRSTAPAMTPAGHLRSASMRTASRTSRTVAPTKMI